VSASLHSCICWLFVATDVRNSHNCSCCSRCCCCIHCKHWKPSQDTENVQPCRRLSSQLLFFLHSSVLLLPHGELHVTLKINGTADTSSDASLKVNVTTDTSSNAALLLLLAPVAVAAHPLRLRANTTLNAIPGCCWAFLMQQPPAENMGPGRAPCLQCLGNVLSVGSLSRSCRLLSTEAGE